MEGQNCVFIHMENISGYHKYLFLGKITGSLSEEEEQELTALFAEDNAVKESFDVFRKKFPAEDVSHSFDYLNEDSFWDGHLPGEIVRIRKRDHQLKLLKRTGAAVALVGIIIFTWTFWFKDGTENTTSPTIAGNTKETIKLTLSNGKVIDLNKEKGEIKSDHLVLQNDSGSLSYQDNSQVGNGINSIIVPVGMDYKLNLSDGSKIWMNSKTKVDFPSAFTGEKREISISGEAYLEVAKDPSRPFIVNLGNTKVRVLGTAFNVNTYEESETRVSLVQGSVSLAANNTSLTLKPGREGIYTSNTQLIRERPFESNSTLSWREGIIYYDSASLNNIARVVDRWYGIQIKVDDPVLLKKQFAGIINKNEPIDVFLDNIKTIANIESYFDKQGVLHFK